jgi:hypothetical protein
MFIDDATNAFKVVVKTRQENGLPSENYWLYFKKDGSAIDVSKEENKRKDYIGFFVEDDTRINHIVEIAVRKVKKLKK